MILNKYHTILTLTAHSYHPSPADSQSAIILALPLFPSHSLPLSLLFTFTICLLRFLFTLVLLTNTGERLQSISLLATLSKLC
jgi:hypothetical protein